MPVSEPWRTRCPEGHCSVKARVGGYYYCDQCGQRYSHLVDVKTGEKIT